MTDGPLPLPCLEDETDFTEPRYYDVGGQPVVRRDRDSLPVGFLPGGAETPVPYGTWAYTGRRIAAAEFAAMRAAQDAGLVPPEEQIWEPEEYQEYQEPIQVPPFPSPEPFQPPPEISPPPALESVEGRVTRLLRDGFVLENAHGLAVRVATQVSGRQTGLRLGDRVRVSGGTDAKGTFLSGWASKTGADGQEAAVPVSRDDLRRAAQEAAGATPRWPFRRR